MRVAVIPARSGSKRIPRKNIKMFCGRPMIAWAIDNAKASGLFSHVVVSTDDDEIAEIAAAHGAEVPFRRPVDLSDDFATTAQVMAHAVDWMRVAGWNVSALCCIYATAPLLLANDLQRGWRAFESGEWEYVFSVTDFPSSIFRAFQQNASGGLEMVFPQHALTRTQDLSRALHDAGQFYWGKPSAWMEQTPIFDRSSLPLFIPRWRVQDIDDEDDWVRAEMIFKQMRLDAHD
jgi:pseudaminic acid cytidylyltransferase